MAHGGAVRRLREYMVKECEKPSVAQYYYFLHATTRLTVHQGCCESTAPQDFLQETNVHIAVPLLR